jgi:DNA ligase D-like protein (predicted ligase)
MLPVAEPLTDETDFVHEIKWDGFRALAYLDGEQVVLQSRSGYSLNNRFPQIAAALAQRKWKAVLDGEIVALSGRGVDFSLLKTAASGGQLCFVVFDLLVWKGEPLLAQPWCRRREELEGVITTGQGLLVSPLLSGNLQENLDWAKENHWEGIVSKHQHSPYLPGVRSRWWRKHRLISSLDAVVVGLRLRGSQVRSAALGLYGDDGALVFIGNAGSGLSARDRAFLREAVHLLAVDRPAVANPPPNDHSWVWFQPHLVAEVEYLELTPQLRLRHPVFLRFRFDKRPEECRLEGELH